MKKLSLISISFILLFSINTWGKNYQGEEAKKIIPGAANVIINDRLSTISMIEFEPNSLLHEDELGNWLLNFKQNYFPNIDFILTKTETGKDGFKLLQYQEYIEFKKVAHGVLNIHVKDKQIRVINGELYNTPTPLHFEKKISQDEAKQIAITYFLKNKKAKGFNTETKLLDEVFYASEKNLVPCYKIELYLKTPEPKKSDIYISAIDGKIIKEENKIFYTNSNGTAVTLYSGTQNIKNDSLSPTNFTLNENGVRPIHTYNLATGTNYPSAVNFVNSSSNWTSNLNLDRAGNDAHLGAEKTWDFYLTKFGRNSYDNAGTPLNSYVHYSTAFVNAYWNGTEMTYGDGDNSQGYGPVVSMDIVGHEITHAVTGSTAGLVYSNESGALNESFSDIFGVTIDYYANPSTANFLEGDQINVSGIPFRDMSNPNNTQQPDTYLGTYWYSGSGDNGGVHTNSQVQNYWYYLLCNGGIGTNDIGNNFNVTSITMNKAAAIAYRTLTNYLTANAQYADARTYSIQSAIDLYGLCSNEVMQVTNAWYAVGVGSYYTNSVQANFHADNTYLCSIADSVHFTNNSLNASTYLWYFGDGTTSTATNPVHHYASTGIFSVKLIATGTAACGGTHDTLLLPNYISVNNIALPSTALCIPVSPNPNVSFGILNVNLDSINKTSSNSTEGYKDFTCTDKTTLILGSQYNIKITLEGLSETAAAWIDFDNNGVFSNSEVIAYLFSGNQNTIQSLFTIPSSAVLNTPLRMRVMSAYNTSISNACQNPDAGQAEDYSIKIVQATTPPVANFTMSPNSTTINSPIQLTDLSLNGPSSWEWTAVGGTPSINNTQNNTVSFSTPGTYNVKLKVSNAFGSDSMTQTVNIISEYDMCSTNSNQITTDLTGNLFDSGGPNGYYQDNENCTFLIAPIGCTNQISLNVTSFSSELNYDYLKIYDDSNLITAHLLYAATGNLTPFNVVSATNKMYFVWNSDFSVNYSGFAASWVVSQPPNTLPIAQFNHQPFYPAFLDTVYFQDLSTASVLHWFWDFGDGTTSTLQNPSHRYLTSGTFTVKLIVKNCLNDADSFLQNIIIQPAPQIQINPNSLTAYLNCHDTANFIINIENLNGGQLNWHLNVSNSVNVSINPLSGSTLQGNSDSVFCQIWANGLAVGIDTQFIFIHTNDPLHLIDTLPIYVHISAKPCVDFSYSLLNICNNSYRFIDSSTHTPTSWFWDFGDGTYANVQNPIHNYTASGTYNVKLIASNSSGMDSFTKQIIVSLTSGPIATTCLPPTINYCCYTGILNFALNTINNPSLNAYEGYKDFSCTQFTHLVKGSVYNFTISANPYVFQYFTLYIDTNNNGIFEPYEAYYYNYSTYGDFNGTLIAPINAPSNTPLRMRIIGGANYYNSGSCTAIDNGQAEDYTIFLDEAPPIAGFYTNPSYQAYKGQPIQITDQSYFATNWEYTMPNGTPNYSTQSNPIVSYNTIGNFDIKQKVSNSIGSDSISQTIQIINLPHEYFYTNTYCSNDITINSYVNGNDPYTQCVYYFGDGDSTVTTIYNQVINHHYNQSGTYIISMISQGPYGNDTSTNSVTINAWNAHIAKIGTIALNQLINFSVTSTSLLNSYYWDFGDGNYSSLSNPIHAYTQVGTYYISADIYDVNGCNKKVYDTIVINTLGINNPSLMGRINIFPNPIKNNFQLEVVGIKSAAHFELKIYNTIGQLAFQFKEENKDFTNKTTFTLADLPAGVYSMIVMIDDVKYIRKIVKE